MSKQKWVRMMETMDEAIAKRRVASKVRQAKYNATRAANLAEQQKEKIN
jgi:hypothetical protein